MRRISIPFALFFQSPLRLFAIPLAGSPLFQAEAQAVKEVVKADLDTVAELALRANPTLEETRLRIAEAGHLLNQAGRLPHPELEFEWQQDPGFDEHRFEIGLARQFPLTKRRQLEKAISRNAVAEAETNLRNLQRLLIAEVRSIAVSCLALDMEKDLRSKQAEVDFTLARQAEEFASRGERSSLEAAQARMQWSETLLAIRRIEAARARELGALEVLLGLEAGQEVALSGALPPLGALPPADPEAPLRPDYEQARLAAEAAELEVRLEQARRYPDIRLGVFAESAREEDAPHGLESETTFGFRVAVPLPFWDRNEGAIAAKMVKLQRAAESARTLANRISREEDTARRQMNLHAGILRQIDENLLPAAVELERLTEAAYRSGKADITAVFQSRRQRLELALTRLESLRDYHRARVAHEAATGSALQP